MTRARTSKNGFRVKFWGPMFFIATGLTMLAMGLREIVMAERSKDWPATVGELTVSRTPYRKEIEYTYSVNDLPYTSDRIIFGELGNRTIQRHRAQFEALPDKSEVPVFYQPDNPSNSVLVKGERSEEIQTFIFVGGGFLLGGLFFTLILARRSA
jgi:hypothetical protein